MQDSERNGNQQERDKSRSGNGQLSLHFINFLSTITTHPGVNYFTASAISPTLGNLTVVMDSLTSSHGERIIEVLPGFMKLTLYSHLYECFVLQDTFRNICSS